ncbi:MAG TPA: hypothetical protein P5307_20865, partial [Pirellulaceae bacterium]|nr:hypothetical protein [Pirellulaceae bacterium]
MMASQRDSFDSCSASGDGTSDIRDKANDLKERGATTTDGNTSTGAAHLGMNWGDLLYINSERKAITH